MIKTAGTSSSFRCSKCKKHPARCMCGRGNVKICDHRSVPGKTECLEAVWSQGRSCRTCYRNDCYRQGWQKSRVDDDNAAFVRAKQIEYIKCPRCQEELGDCEPDGCRDPLCPMQEQFDYDRDPTNQPENIR